MVAGKRMDVFAWFKTIMWMLLLGVFAFLLLMYDKHKIMSCFSAKQLDLVGLMCCRTWYFSHSCCDIEFCTFNRSKLCRVNLSHLRSSLKLVFPFRSLFSIKFHILFIIIIRLGRCCSVFALFNWITNILY